MNGHTQAGIDAYGGSPFDDYEPMPETTDVPCPRCGRALGWSGYVLYCDTCGENGDFPAIWIDLADMERTREKLGEVPPDF